MIQRRQLIKHFSIGLSLMSMPFTALVAKQDKNISSDTAFYYTVLREHLSQFTVSDDDLYTYIEDAKAELKVHKVLNKRLSRIPFSFQTLELLYSNSSFIKNIPKIGNYINIIEDNIVGNFLISTDYYFHMPRKKELKYQGFFSPYKKICHNPFANLQIKAES